MPTLPAIKNQMNNLINLGNETTGKTDETITDVINSLIAGYGGGFDIGTGTYIGTELINDYPYYVVFYKEGNGYGVCFTTDKTLYYNNSYIEINVCAYIILQTLEEVYRLIMIDNYHEQCNFHFKNSTATRMILKNICDKKSVDGVSMRVSSFANFSTSNTSFSSDKAKIIENPIAVPSV